MALYSRLLEPEWLDELPPDDPRAARSRADLRRVNAIMGNARVIARHLGHAQRKLKRKLEVTIVDRIAGLEAFEFLAAPGQPLDAIVANLFLHHLTEPGLRRLFALAADRAPLFIACEPRRSRLALAGSRLTWAIGANHVTRHDAVVSVRAGFTGRELSALWPLAPGWTLTEQLARPFSHLFVARRHAAA